MQRAYITIYCTVTFSWQLRIRASFPKLTPSTTSTTTAYTTTTVYTTASTISTTNSTTSITTSIITTLKSSGNGENQENKQSARVTGSTTPTFGIPIYALVLIAIGGLVLSLGLVFCVVKLVLYLKKRRRNAVGASAGFSKVPLKLIA